MMICSDETHPDTVVTCPYDQSHKIARGRLQRHLVKCEKHFPEDYLEICPYNATHRSFKAQMKEHILVCPMRRLLQPSVYQSSMRTKDYISNRLNFETTNTIDFLEPWSDDESDCQSRKQETESVASVETYEKTADERDSDDYDYSKPLRRPFGYSEVMMMEVNNSIDDDMMSISSGMAMGRGRGVAKPAEKHLFKKIGMGRGKGIISFKNL